MADTIEAIKARDEAWQRCPIAETSQGLAVLAAQTFKDRHTLIAECERLQEANRALLRDLADLGVAFDKEEADNQRLRDALRPLYGACLIADFNGDLSSDIDGNLLDKANTALAGEPQSVCRWRWVRFRGWRSDCYPDVYFGPKSVMDEKTECPKCGKPLEVVEPSEEESD